MIWRDVEFCRARKSLRAVAGLQNHIKDLAHLEVLAFFLRSFSRRVACNSVVDLVYLWTDFNLIKLYLWTISLDIVNMFWFTVLLVLIGRSAWAAKLRVLPSNSYNNSNFKYQIFFPIVPSSQRH